jgi:hypothetical protein
MNALTSEQLALLSARVVERKRVLLDDIRRVLKRSGSEHYADLLGGTGDTGDEAAASLLRDVTEAEVVRDVGELSDIAAAQERMAAGEKTDNLFTRNMKQPYVLQRLTQRSYYFQRFFYSTRGCCCSTRSRAVASESSRRSAR